MCSDTCRRAGNHGKSERRGRVGFGKPKSFDVTLIKAAMLNNGVVLPPGNYTVKISEDTQSPEAEFYKPQRLVARAPVQVQARPEKNDYTTIEADIG
jgi:hypothetical protein